MDKYQKYIFQKMFNIKESFIFSRCCPSNFHWDNTEYGKFYEDDDTFELRQDEEFTKTKYLLSIKKKEHTPFLRIETKHGENWEKAEEENGSYIIVADFNDRIEAIKFVFRNNLADDYILNMQYKEVNKTEN